MFPSYSYLWPVLYLRFIFKMFEQNDLGAFFFWKEAMYTVLIYERLKNE